MSKTWYTSKTLWANVIGIGVIAVQSQYGYVVDAGTQVTLLALINIALRKITKEEIVWTKTDA